MAPRDARVSDTCRVYRGPEHEPGTLARHGAAADSVADGDVTGATGAGETAAPVRSGLWAEASRRIGVLHLVVGPFIASKAIAVLVPMATLWARSTGVGIPPASNFLSLFAQSDGAAYAQIAANGYPAGPLQLGPNTLGYLWARSPGYPLLVHIATYVIPQTVVAGIVVSAVGELIALVFLAKLVLHERGDEASASFACWALAVFPYAFYLTAVYTESAFLAAAIACLYYMRRGKEGPASLAAGCAMLIHITGAALVPALIIDHLVRRRGRPGRGLLVILASLLSPLLQVAYAWHLTGDPLAYVHAAEGPSFHRILAWPWAGAYTAWTNFVGGTRQATASCSAWRSSSAWATWSRSSGWPGTGGRSRRRSPCTRRGSG